MNVFRFEIRAYFKQAIIFGFSMAVFGLMFIVLYPGFTKDMKSFLSLLEAYPPEVLKALGADLELMTSFSGFYGFCVIYIIFCGAIQGMFIGISIISKENSRKTAEFMFTKPMNRRSILTAKLLAAITTVSITFVIYTILTFVASVLIIEEFGWKELILINASLWLVQVVFVALGFGIACRVGKIKVPITTAIGLSSIFFALQMIVNGTNDEILSYFSIMTYFNPNDIIIQGGYELKYFLCWIGITVAGIVSGFVVFQRKDIQIG